MKLTQGHVRFSTPYRLTVSFFFLTALTLFCLSLLHYASHYSTIFLLTVPSLVCVAMLVSFFTDHPTFKQSAATITLLVVLTATLFHPLNQQAWQLEYYFFPLCFVVLFPGTWWPVASACVLLFSSISIEFWLHSPAMIEHILALFLITVLANFTVYYKNRLTAQMMIYRHDSLTDFLTGARNRKAFQKDLDTIQTCPETCPYYALIIIDLDNFKRINDSLGHLAGDQLLIEIAEHLNQVNQSDNEQRPSEVYRLSGDEFALIVYDETDIELATQVIIKRIQSLFTEHYEVNNHQYCIKASLGISLLKHANNDVHLWYHNGDLAMYRAKDSGKNHAQWFDAQLLSETQRQYRIEQELSEALVAKQLTLYYQPKVSLDDHSVKHAEALIRWQHPHLGTIYPDEFISIAEKSHQIIAIGRWVIDTACHQAKLWQQQGFAIQIAVNVSTIQFLYDDICQVVKDALHKHQLPADYLELEITETTMMSDFERVIQTCNAVRELGVAISIDDFGTVYSSLNYIKQLPVDTIKIDKSFIDDSITNQTDRMIVKTIIQLGHNLNKTVIAEGVDSIEQRDMLAAEHCNFYQGYLYAKPMCADDFIHHIQQFQPQPKVDVNRAYASAR